jgi:hypothetical protein
MHMRLLRRSGRRGSWLLGLGSGLGGLLEWLVMGVGTEYLPSVELESLEAEVLRVGHDERRIGLTFTMFKANGESESLGRF